MKMTTFTGILALACAASLKGSVPGPASDFQAMVNGQPLELHEFTQGVFGLFEVTRPVDIEIRLGFDVRWVNVRPKSAKIDAAIGTDHRSVRFRMTGTVPLTVEFNDDILKGRPSPALCA